MGADPLLERTDMRFVAERKYNNLYVLYKKAVASFWSSEEIDLAQDRKDWADRLTPDEKQFVLTPLAFFAASDGIVNENIVLRFYAEVSAFEAKAFYGFQIAMETIHSEVYAQLVETFADDSEHRDRLFGAIGRTGAIQSKARWALRWLDSDAPLAQRLVAFACVEGIHFSSSFCALFWLKKRGLMPGLTFSNELISRDEGLHTQFACALHAELQEQCDAETIRSIVLSAVEVEKQFVDEALKVSLIGMNAKDMGDYVEFVADYLLVMLGVDKAFNTANPFDWMELISLQGKTKCVHHAHARP